MNNAPLKMQPAYDVIVAGAGPVGLFLACELALAKCSVLVLEKNENLHSPLKQFPFGIRGLSAPTVEALYRRGLLPGLELHKRLKSPHQTPPPTDRGRQLGHFAGIPFYEGDIETSQWKYRLPGSPAASLLSSMEEIESVLAGRAELLGVTILRGLGVSGFQQTAQAVTVQAGGQFLEARWLVGCDGSRSAVRKAGGFEFAGTEPEFTGYSALLDIADPEKLKPGRNLTPAGMYMQSQPGYVVMADFDKGAGHATESITREQLQEVLRRVSNTGVTIDALHTVTTWTDRARQATAYRNGRVFLAGDAAHIHSPLGGQGLNLGVGDALNLGWKLAAVIHGKASQELLDTYQTERHPLGSEVLNWSRAQVAIIRPDPSSRALNAIVRDLMNTCDGATYFAARVWGVFTHYDLGGGHPLIGHSAPDFEFENGARLGGFMHDGHAILLDFDSVATRQTFAAAFGESIKYVPGRAREQFGLSAILIRPDGVVAWATASNPDSAEWQTAAARWLGKEAI